MNISKSSVKPEDILSDGENFADLNGITVRKGYIVAFYGILMFLRIHSL